MAAEVKRVKKTSERTFLSRFYQQLREKKKGQSLVEFALMLPILLLLTLGAVDFGRALHAVIVHNNATYNAAVWAAANLRYGTAGTPNCGAGNFCCPTANNTSAPNTARPTTIREAALIDFTVGLNYTTTCDSTSAGLSSTCNPSVSCTVSTDTYTYGASATPHRYVEVTLNYRWTALGPYDALVGQIDIPRTVRVRRLP